MVAIKSKVASLEKLISTLLPESNPDCVLITDDVSSALVESQEGSSTELTKQKDQEVTIYKERNSNSPTPEPAAIDATFRQAISHSSSTGSLVAQMADLNSDAAKRVSGGVVAEREEEVVTGEAKKYVGWKSETMDCDHPHKSQYEDEIVGKYGREVYDNFMAACRDWASTYSYNNTSKDITPIINNERFTAICDMQDIVGLDMLKSLFVEWIDSGHNEFVVPLAWVSEGHKVPYEYGELPVAWVGEADVLEGIFNTMSGVSTNDSQAE